MISARKFFSQFKKGVTDGIDDKTTKAGDIHSKTGKSAGHGAHGGTLPFAGPGQGARLEAVHQGEPVIGWRYARMSLDVTQRRIGLYSLYQAHQFGAAEEKAECIPLGMAAMLAAWGYPRDPSTKHDAPHVGCSCGFWAYAPARAAVPRFGLVRCEVELYGRVLEYSDEQAADAYRGEYQRVLGVWLPKECCSFLCDKDASYVHFSAPYIRPGGESQVVAGFWTPLCHAHIRVDMKNTVSLAGLAGELGVDVRWETAELSGE